MPRVTQKELGDLLRVLNSQGAGVYSLEWAYGRPRLYTDGGSREVSPRLPTGQMADWMRAFLAGIGAARKHVSESGNPKEETTFDRLLVGDRFDFWPREKAEGPWYKLGARVYRHVDDPEDRNRVDSVKARVVKYSQNKPDVPVQIEKIIKGQWNIASVVSELKVQPWYITERYAEAVRIDRMVNIGSYDSVQDLARDTVSKREWDEAVEGGVGDELESEIADDYVNYLAEVVADKMGEHVYGTFEEGDAWLGQYEEGPLSELKAKFEIEED